MLISIFPVTAPNPPNSGKQHDSNGQAKFDAKMRYNEDGWCFWSKTEMPPLRYILLLWTRQVSSHESSIFGKSFVLQLRTKNQKLSGRNYFIFHYLSTYHEGANALPKTIQRWMNGMVERVRIGAPLYYHPERSNRIWEPKNLQRQLLFKSSNEEIRIPRRRTLWQ